MIDAYTVGITLALDHGVAAGIASIQRDLTIPSKAIAESAIWLELLRTLGQQISGPSPKAQRIAPEPAIPQPVTHWKPIEMPDPAEVNERIPIAGRVMLADTPVAAAPAPDRPPPVPVNDPAAAPQPELRRSDASITLPTIKQPSDQGSVAPLVSRAAPHSSDHRTASQRAAQTPLVRFATIGTSLSAVYFPLVGPPLTGAMDANTALNTSISSFDGAPIDPTVPVQRAGQIAPGRSASLNPGPPPPTRGPVPHVSLPGTLQPTEPASAAPSSAAAFSSTAPWLKISRRHQTSDGALTRLSRPLPSGSPADSKTVPETGGLFLDGARVGRWVFNRLGEQVTRPQMGFTGLDPRMTPSFPGAPTSG